MQQPLRLFRFIAQMLFDVNAATDAACFGKLPMLDESYGYR